MSMNITIFDNLLFFPHRLSDELYNSEEVIFASEEELPKIIDKKKKIG